MNLDRAIRQRLKLSDPVPDDWQPPKAIMVILTCAGMTFLTLILAGMLRP